MYTLSDQDWHLIESKIRGELSASDQSLFIEKMNNRVFKEAYLEEHRIVNGLLEIGDKKLKEELQSFEQNHVDNSNSNSNSNSKKKKQIISSTIWRWIILGVIAGLAAYFATKSIRKANISVGSPIMAELYKPYPNTAFQIERSPSSKNILHNAFSAYEDGAYSKAISFFEEVSDSLSNNEVLLYLGMSYFGNKDYKKALLSFSDSANFPSQYKNAVDYYFAICMHETGQSRNANVILEQIKNSSNEVYWKKRADELLQFYQKDIEAE